MSEQDRQAQHLSKKIENVLPIIYSACMTNAFKEKWKWPERDPDTGLFIDKYCKFLCLSKLLQSERRRRIQLREMLQPWTKTQQLVKKSNFESA